MVDTIIGACYNKHAKIYRRLPKQYEDLKMGEKKNTNILLMSMTNDLLLAELNKRGLSEFGWDSCEIENLKHDLTCAIERGDSKAMIIYALMLEYRGYRSASIVKEVLDGLRDAHRNNQSHIGELQSTINEKIGRINDLNDRLRYAESRFEGMEKKYKDLHAAVEKHAPWVFIKAGDKKSFTDCRCKQASIDAEHMSVTGSIDVGHGLHLVDAETNHVELTKPFKKKLAEFLAKHLTSWPKEVVAFGPLTTFNGFVGRRHLEDYAVSADLWKEAVEKSGRDLLTEDEPLDDSEIGCQVCAAKGWGECHGHSEAEDPETCKDDEANDGPNTIITVEIDTGRSRITIQGTAKDVQEVATALGVSYK